jgi:hypothetical protein
MKIIKLLFCLLIMTPPSYALAGDPGGPYAVWVNMSDKVVISKFLSRRVAKAKNDDSFDNAFDVPSLIDAEVLFYERPSDITDELVRRAVIKNDKKAIKILNKIMRRDYEGFYGGFDGIIVYDEEDGPRFSLIQRGVDVVFKEKIPSRKDPKSVWETFLLVIPEVTRKP